MLTSKSSFFLQNNDLNISKISNSTNSQAAAVNSGGSQLAEERETWMGGSDTHALKTSDLSLATDTCQLQTTHIPLVFSE